MAALASIPAGDPLTLLSQGNLGMVAGRTCHRFLFSLSRLWRWIFIHFAEKFSIFCIICALPLTDI